MDSGFTHFDFTLRDGRSVHIRAMRPSDEAAILRAFERLSPEARYMRFMRVMGDPNIERLRAALESFPESGLGIVAIFGSGEIAGAAMFLIGGDRPSCEFATTVAGQYGGQSLGQALLTAPHRCGETARAAGNGGLRADEEPADGEAGRPTRLQHRTRPGRVATSP